MKRRFNSLFLILAICVLVSVGAFSVYAALSVSVNFTNQIMFRVNDDAIFFKAEVTVVDANEDIIFGNEADGNMLDYSGETASSRPDADSNYELNMLNPINFYPDTNEYIVYTIKITNYSDFAVKTELSFAPEYKSTNNVLLLQNSNLGSSGSINLSPKNTTVNPITYDFCEYKVKTTCKNFLQSFVFQNTITVNLTKINN